MQSILFATHYARLRRATAGATFAALLKSELSDSPMLGYLRRACLASCGTIGNLSFSANAKKAPIKYYLYSSEGEIYELNFEPRAALVCNRIEKHIPSKAKSIGASQLLL